MKTFAFTMLVEFHDDRDLELALSYVRESLKDQLGVSKVTMLAASAPYDKNYQEVTKEPLKPITG